MQKIITTIRRTLMRRYAPYGAVSALAAALALTSVFAQAMPTAHASASTVRYTRGYSVQHGWLCYGWPNGAFHCTQHWRASGGRYVSLNPSWVPSEGGAASVSSHASSVRSVTTYSYHVANAYPFGQCTYGAQALRPSENLSGLGNARDWLWRARARGMATGYTPRVGATVVFQPGVQGASWLGHVGHVVAVGANGAFLMEAMNDSAGWGRFAYRWVHAGAGVGFIY